MDGDFQNATTSTIYQHSYTYELTTNGWNKYIFHQSKVNDSVGCQILCALFTTYPCQLMAYLNETMECFLGNVDTTASVASG